MGLSGVYGEAICRKQALLVSHYRRAFGAHGYARSRPYAARNIPGLPFVFNRADKQPEKQTTVYRHSRGSIDTIEYVFENASQFCDARRTCIVRPPLRERGKSQREGSLTVKRKEKGKRDAKQSDVPLHTRCTVTRL